MNLTGESLASFRAKIMPFCSGDIFSFSPDSMQQHQGGIREQVQWKR
jgi:hypothetical protein